MSELLLIFLALFIIPNAVGALLPQAYTNWATRYLFGLVMIGIIVTSAHGFGWPQSLPGLMIGFAAIAGVCLSFYRRDWKQESTFKLKLALQRRQLSTSLIWLAALAALTSILLFTYSEVFNHPLAAWDALTIWFSKAKAIYFWQDFVSTPIIAYPNLGPSLWAYVMSIAGLQEHFGRLVFPLIYILWSGGLLYLLPKTGQVWTRWVYLLAWFAVSLFLLQSDAWNGYQDIYLAVLAATSAHLLAKALIGTGPQRWWDLGLGLFFAGSLYLVKNEGLVLAVIIVAVLGLLSIIYYRKSLLHAIRYERRKLVKLTPLLLIFALPVLLWVAILAYNQVDPGQVQGNAFTLKGLLSIPERLGNWREIARYLLAELRQWWPIFVAAAGLSILALLTASRAKLRQRLSVNAFLWMIVILHSTFVGVVFFATNADLAWHLSTAFQRLMSQHNLIFAVIILWNLSWIAQAEQAASHE